MPQSFSEQTGTFRRLLVLFKGFLPRLQKSFFCLSAWRSSIIPHPRLIVNTFFHLFCLFSIFFFHSLFPPSLSDCRRSGKTMPHLLTQARPARPCFIMQLLIIIFVFLDKSVRATYHEVSFYSWYNTLIPIKENRYVLCHPPRLYHW